jgi:hypothetical protein
MKICIRMAREGERRQTRLRDFDPELLAQFADERIFRRLARLHFAAGKFPKPGERLAFRPLGQQHASIGVDKRAGHHQHDPPSGPVSHACTISLKMRAPIRALG